MTISELPSAAGLRPRRVVYLGSPAAAVPPLRALVGAGIEVVRVVTRAPKRARRGPGLDPTPVHAAADELGLPVTSSLDGLEALDVDLGVVVAFGRLIKPPLLGAYPLVNLHFSLLPRWRGAAPVERALLAGDAVTGVCLMAIEAGLDTGAVYDRVEVPIGARTTVSGLRGELVAAGTDLLVRTLTGGVPDPAPQSGEATHADKLTTDEFDLDFARPAAEVDRLVRAERAFTAWRGKRLKVHTAVPREGVDLAEPGTLDGPKVACADGWLELVTVQPEGKPAMPAAQWLNGARPAPAERLGV